MNRILAIDTVTEACSAAVFYEGEIFQRMETVGTGHSRQILDMVDQVLTEAQLSLGQLDAIAVDSGPGSFTGVRIGLGVAQGLAFGAGISALGICSLEVLASMSGPGVVLPAIDARMGQVYCALYQVGNDCRPVQLEAPVVTNPDELPFPALNLDRAVGSGWGVYSRSLLDSCEAAGSRNFELRGEIQPEATTLARLAAFADSKEFVAPAKLAASYVRNRVAEKPGKQVSKGR